MKTFDFEAARRGAAVCMANGTKVRIVSFSSDSPIYPIIGVIKDQRILLWTSQGKLANGESNPGDLQMEHDDYLERLARGEYSLPDNGFTSDPMPSSDDTTERSATPTVAPDSELIKKALMSKSSCIDPTIWLLVLCGLFSFPNAPASKLRVNIEYDGQQQSVDWVQMMEAAAKLRDRSGDVPAQQ